MMQYAMCACCSMSGSTLQLLDQARRTVMKTTDLHGRMDFACRCFVQGGARQFAIAAAILAMRPAAAAAAVAITATFGVGGHGTGGSPVDVDGREGAANRASEVLPLSSLPRPHLHAAPRL